MWLFKIFKVLGINIDLKINWSIHIDTVCNQISRVNYLGDLETILFNPMYFGLFQSHYIVRSTGMGLFFTCFLHYCATEKGCVYIIANIAVLEVPTVVNLSIFQVQLCTKSNVDLSPIRQEFHQYRSLSELGI